MVSLNDRRKIAMLITSRTVCSCSDKNSYVRISQCSVNKQQEFWVSWALPRSQTPSTWPQVPEDTVPCASALHWSIFLLLPCCFFLGDHLIQPHVLNTVQFTTAPCGASSSPWAVALQISERVQRALALDRGQAGASIGALCVPANFPRCCVSLDRFIQSHIWLLNCSRSPSCGPSMEWNTLIISNRRDGVL